MSQAIAKRQRLSESLAAAQADAQTASAASAAEVAAIVAARISAAAAKREENFMCSICVGLLNEPVTTPCGHNFCLKCISLWRQKSPACPLCGDVPTGLQLAVNKLIEAAIADTEGPLFRARDKAERFYKLLESLDPAGALAELVAAADTSRFVGDAEKRMTPLLWACVRAGTGKQPQWIALAKALIARPETDVNALSAEGRSALSLVALTGSSDVMGELVPPLFAKGARCKLALGHALSFSWAGLDLAPLLPFVSTLTLLAKDDFISPWTIAQPGVVLASALKNGFDGVATALVDKGFSTNPAVDALRYAASGGCAEAIKLLCTGGTPLPVDTLFDSRKTALHVACAHGRAHAALALLECGATVAKFSPDEYNMSPLM
jgi:hypothetical protein